MAGWSEKVLDIDLNTQTYKVYSLDMEMARLFIGGRGLGARLLWDMVGPEVDPFSSENVLIFTTVDRHRLPDQQPFFGYHQEPVNGHRIRCQFRRLLGYAVQKGRLRCDDRTREG